MEAAILVFIFSCQLIALLSAHHPPPPVLDRDSLPKIGTDFLNPFFFAYFCYRVMVHRISDKILSIYCFLSGREYKNLTKVEGRLLEVPLPGGVRAGCQVF
jgi:hypothetical protein